MVMYVNFCWDKKKETKILKTNLKNNLDCKALAGTGGISCFGGYTDDMQVIQQFCNSETKCVGKSWMNYKPNLWFE